VRVIVHWSGGKDCCTALHKVIEEGHEVTHLVTYVYMEPYIFHSVRVAKLQAEALGIPHLKVKVEAYAPEKGGEHRGYRDRRY
jgi:diphthine-ammonia ligase